MFTKVLLAGAFAALAAAQSTVLSFTSAPSTATAGQPATLLYTTNDTASPVTILLRKGASTNLQTISTLTSSSVGGSYTWTPDSSLVAGNDYALEIDQGTQVNYFGPFTLVSSTTSSSASSSASAYSTVSASAYSTLSSSSGSSFSAVASTGIITYPASNATITYPVGTGASSAGTGIPIARNTTLSSATLSATSTGAATTRASASNTGASTGASASATGVSTNSAVAHGGSAVLALVFGALAAVALC